MHEHNHPQSVVNDGMETYIQENKAYDDDKQEIQSGHWPRFGSLNFCGALFAGGLVRVCRLYHG